MASFPAGNIRRSPCAHSLGEISKYPSNFLYWLLIILSLARVVFFFFFRSFFCSSLLVSFLFSLSRWSLFSVSSSIVVCVFLFCSFFAFFYCFFFCVLFSHFALSCFFLLIFPFPYLQFLDYLLFFPLFSYSSAFPILLNILALCSCSSSFSHSLVLFFSPFISAFFVLVCSLTPHIISFLKSFLFSYFLFFLFVSYSIVLCLFSFRHVLFPS